MELFYFPNPNPLIYIPLSTGLVFIAVGFIMNRYPPKTINSFYGYRTPSSMKNQEQWNFAQLYSSNLMIKLGVILCLLSILGFFVQCAENIALSIALAVFILFCVILIWNTEMAIKKKFKKS